MKSLVRPELPTASVGSSQATTDAVDNSALVATRPQSTYKSGKVVQTNGATSLAEMLAVDALLIMQASNCNAQIPAKIYEYLRAGKPILGLTDPDGDTAGVMRHAGLNDMARLDSVDEIAVLLPRLVREWHDGKKALPLAHVVQQASRRRRSEAFASLWLQAVDAAKPMESKRQS